MRTSSKLIDQIKIIEVQIGEIKLQILDQNAYFNKQDLLRKRQSLIKHKEELLAEYRKIKAEESLAHLTLTLRNKETLQRNLPDQKTQGTIIRILEKIHQELVNIRRHMEYGKREP